MSENTPIYFENKSQRAITVDGVTVPPKGIGMAKDSEHKGVKSALAKGVLSESNEKEYKAYTDPAAVKAAAEAKSKAEAEKKVK